jgi:1-acyl-sn-glycerol-3-phosphate acyltransferase
LDNDIFIFIKSLVFYFIFYITLIPTSIIIILCSLILSGVTSQKIGRFWIINILRVLKLICGISWRVTGLENLPKKPFIMVSNHQGPWESLFLQTLFIPTSSIIKKEILLIPFFGWAISRMNPVAINRKEKFNSLKKVIRVGGERIKSGYAVLIFPEGTRRKPQDGIGKFGNSYGALAINEGVPVVPICHDSGKFWLNHTIQKKKGEIQIKIGEPIHESDQKILSEKVYLWIKNSYNDIC